VSTWHLSRCTSRLTPARLLPPNRWVG
jgi:hypothetical protein